MNTGKLISFSPKMNGNVHETFTGQNGTSYKFIAVIEENGNQITGALNSSKQQPSWKVGEMYNYEIVISGQNGQYTNFKSFKSVNGFSGGKKADPAFVVQKAFECAVEAAIDFLVTNKDSYTETLENQIITVFFNKIIEVKEENKRWARISALRLAVKKYVSLKDKIQIAKPSAWILENIVIISDVMISTVEKTIKGDESTNN